MNQATVSAHPNIALVKYWGKQSGGRNIPVSPSVSVTLDTLTTTTTVEQSFNDLVVIDGQDVKNEKISTWLEFVREKYGIPPICIRSESNFPASSGLASSASGFAALAVAVNQACGLELESVEISELARIGSASAARSMLGGFVSLKPEDESCSVLQLHPKQHWDLKVVVAITDPRQKGVPSTEGMERSVETSTFHEAWRQTTEGDYQECLEALEARDFARLSRVAESNCCKMHGLMLTSVPPLIYWKPGTLSALDTLRKLQEAEVPTFFTIDAGPQVKAFCLPEAADAVEEHLQNTPGVTQTIRCGLGDGPIVH